MRATSRIPERRAVLVVDDHPAIRDTLSLLLEGTYEVLVAGDGPSALRVLATRPVDAVLLDLGLPGMDGFDVLTRLRQLKPTLAVIIVTVRDTAADAVRALKLGARDYVTKPFDEEILLQKIAEALAESSVPQRDRARANESETAAKMAPSHVDHYLRPQCLVVANHVGTASTLRLILDRYIPTNATTDGVHAVEALGVGVPRCIVVDESAWAADGSALLRVLRRRAPLVRVALLTARSAVTAHVTLAGDCDVTEHGRLDEVVGYVLRFLAVAGAMITAQPLSARIFAALEYLRLHHAEPLSADRIAEAAGMSRSCLAERFRSELGTSFSHFVITLRVEIARLLLLTRPAKLDEVAALAGFEDSSHLSRVFHAKTGYRPGAYRRRFAY